jgi:hypothetical protein
LYIFCSFYKTSFMRWVPEQSINQLHYWKLDENEIVAELKYNKEAHSLRILADVRRLFFIERTGFLQQKFLLRTEYSVIAGEIYAAKNGHSGVSVFEGRKFNYSLKENILTLSSKKEHLLFTIEIEDAQSMDQFEFCALLWSSLKVLSRTRKTSTEPVYA